MSRKWPKISIYHNPKLAVKCDGRLAETIRTSNTIIMSKQMDNIERAFYAQQTQPPVLGEDGEIEEEILSFETGLATNAIL